MTGDPGQQQRLERRGGIGGAVGVAGCFPGIGRTITVTLLSSAALPGPARGSLMYGERRIQRPGIAIMSLQRLILAITSRAHDPLSPEPGGSGDHRLAPRIEGSEILTDQYLDFA